MNQSSRFCSVRSSSVLIYTFLLIVTSVPSQALAKSSNSSLAQSASPVPGDYLAYNVTYSGFWSYLNVTFGDYVASDLINISLTAFGEYDYHLVLNTSDSSIFAIKTQNISIGAIIEMRVFFWPWDTRGAVIGEKNLSGGENTYPCWRVKAGIMDYSFDIYYEKISGMLMFMNVTQSGSVVGTMELLEGKLGNFNIIPEFPSFLFLPLFMAALMLATIIYRRKHSMELKGD